ncbi:uncharacterized protein LOC111002758 [Pieris rapae]|uniref:uncharacterized protein LOC111002758 n=1 Tax=Pieris rapae TaxID=64459 RepID=UPI001E27EFED|nr:uncharacterized protein LOC111002758 [Pieris rapae]
MLETSEIDADFFTPAANTSLATIFSNTQTDRNDENKSLIYVPETPMVLVENHKSGDVHKQTSASQCIFATSVSAYEWIENRYNLREKLGFAIVKDIKDDIHNLIIYTSEKRTLSLATITSTFVINVKKDVNISFYDNYKKYWLISSPSSKISDIVKCLENLKVNMTYLNDAEISSPKDVTGTVNNKPDQLAHESLDIDTDSLTNQKNKDSILKRMATMGQSVLPPSKNIVSKSTDSSDSNEYDNPSLLRHKLVKSLPKKHSTERNAGSVMQCNELSKILPNTVKIQDSLIPVNVKNLESLYENNMHSLITEQRISNSELRININRLSDKVDHLCDKTLAGGLQSNLSNNQIEIVNKLLKEYESKIIVYEKFIKLKGFECNLLFTNENEPSTSVKKDSIIETEKDKESQDQIEINTLNKKIDLLTNAFSEMTEKHKQYEEMLLKEIDTLKQDLNNKNESLYSINKSVQSIAANSNSEEYSNKLKNIMNSTFQTISSKFNDEDSYLGTVVKGIVAKIIKKTTMESLNDVN